LSVADHLRLGARLNRSWDQQLAEQRIKQLGLDPAQRAGRLSGGQRAQLALTIAAAKRPELLIFDEPVASLDPLARRAFLRNLLEFVAELDVSVVLSSHVLSDLEQVCDYLVVLVASRVQLAGDVSDLLAEHYLLSGSRADLAGLPATIEVIQAEHTPLRSTAVVRCTAPIPHAILDAEAVSLEQMTMAYLTRAVEMSEPSFSTKALEVQR
jgi:ABC-2 type transport system ATP-binding protein